MYRYLFRRVVSVSLVAMMASGPAWANNCSFLIDRAANREVDSLADGQMFVFNGKNWEPFTSVDALNLTAPNRLQLAYVVKTESGENRGGVLVVKSNRTAAPEDRDDIKTRVRLVRHNVTRDSGCAEIGLLPGNKAWVDTDVYEDYHDYTARRTKALRRDNYLGSRILDAFHFAYRSTIKGRCTATNDDFEDSYGRSSNSNRAQFSFNPLVVQGGVLGLWYLIFPFRSSFDGMAENRTEVKKYRTVDGMACVRFRLPVSPVGYLIRVNDLERFAVSPWYRRVGEEVWPK